jgi:hypothetical protein
VPLILLAACAVVLGWISIPEDFPVIGGAIPDWFHHFIASTTGLRHPAGTATPFQGARACHRNGISEWRFGMALFEGKWRAIRMALFEGEGRPMTIGVAFTLGGLVLGWLVYGWKPLHAGQKDRLEAGMRKAWLGWLYTGLQKHLYLSQIYQATLARGTVLTASLLHTFDHSVISRLVSLAGSTTQVLSQAGKWFDAHIIHASVSLVHRAVKEISEISGILDLRVIDQLVGLTGLGSRTLADWSATFDVKGVDGVIEGVGAITREGAPSEWRRPTQTRSAQDYLLQASLMVLTLIVVFFIILFLKI